MKSASGRNSPQEDFLILVSHVHEYRALRSAFRDSIGRCLLNRVDFSVLCDIIGANGWLERVETALRAAVVLVLESPESLGWPWMNFEIGYLHLLAWNSYIEISQ